MSTSVSGPVPAEDPVYLQYLPSVVGEIICGYLDFSSLQNLRLVCKETKKWIEGSHRILVKLPVEIRVSKQLQQVLQCPVPWNNFSVNMCNLAEQSAKNTEAFLTKYAHRIKVLKIKAYQGYARKLHILSMCPVIESLTLQDLDILQANQETLDRLKYNFRNLKHLRIEDVKSANEKVAEIFFDLAFSSMQLETFTVPSFQLDPPPVGLVLQNFIRDHQQFVASRVIRYLKYRQKTFPGQRNLRVLNLGELKPIVLRASDILKELATTCVETGTQLVNVSVYMLTPTALNSEDYLHRYTHFRDSIRSINGYYLDVDYDAFKNLEKIEFVLHPSSHSHGGESNPVTMKQLLVCLDSQGMTLPKLRILDIRLVFEVQGEFIGKLMSKLLLDQKRPTVTELRISWNLHHDTSRLNQNIGSLFIPNNFSNLKQLELTCWVGTDEEFLDIFRGSGLPCLEDLKVKDCKQLTDVAYVGSALDRNRPPILRLRNLHKLWIRTCNSEISDRSFKHVFSMMRLTHFTFHSVGSPDNLPITMRGLVDLRNGPFAETIEYLDLSGTVHARIWAVNQLFRTFPNIKRTVK